MAIGHLLTAPDSLVTRIESLLAENSIGHRPKIETTVTDGGRIFDLTELQCQSELARVELGIVKRRGRTGVDILVIPSRRFVLWRHRESDQLASRLIRILCENGADDSPDARCERIG